jgi:hypothetical protein
MRIELPIPTWAEAQRVHDDAHTLTVPAHPHPLPLSGGWPGVEAGVARVEVRAGAHAALTLTLQEPAR